MSETQVTAVSSTPKKPRGRRGPRPMTQSAKVRRLLEKDVPVKVIAKRLGITVQAVYRVKYKTKKAQSTGIASLATLPPTEASGIASFGNPSVPPGTIVYVDSAPTPAEAATEVASAERPTLWQRIKLYVWGKK